MHTACMLCMQTVYARCACIVYLVYLRGALFSEAATEANAEVDVVKKSAEPQQRATIEMHRDLGGSVGAFEGAL